MAGALSGPRRLGAYQLVAPLATGGMAELFIAKTAGVSGFEKQVALKVIHPNYSSDPDFVRMLVDEAKLSVQLQHANIVQTYDLGQVGGEYYIAMELIDGADLYKILKTASEKGTDFPVDVAAHITSEVATGLDYAHRKNDPMGRPLKIVHRDVSPQNVLVSREGEIKIVDFGIAKAALRGQHTQAGVIKGKYFYMSPEQASGEKIDARTDVFSTGILLHEMLVGEMLYLEEDLEKLLRMVRAADIQPPSRKRKDVPADLDAIVMKALAKRPDDRFQSAADLSTALQRFLRGRYTDAGRGRVARFAREVLEQDKSYADITLPPANREDFGDENSLIFSLKDVVDTGARSLDEETRGILAPRHDAPRGDFDDGATEFDPNPALGPRGGIRDVGTDPDPIVAKAKGAGARKPSSKPDFGTLGDDAEPTEFGGARNRHANDARADFSSTDEEWTDAESTRQRSNPPPRAPSPPPRRPPPVASVRRPSLPPVASPRPTARPAMDLGVSERERKPPPPQRPGLNLANEPVTDPEGAAPAAIVPPMPLGGVAPTPVTPTPAVRGFAPGTGEQPLVDWSAQATVTPPTAQPYPRSSESVDALSSLQLGTSKQNRKVILVAGALIGVAAVVLAVALLWPEGPAHGSVEIVSRPQGATVRIDGTVLPKITPIRISDLDIHQPHHVAVSMRGYDVWEKDVKFESNERDVRLQAILVPAVGTLEVKSVPPGAEAIVNGRIGGVTPTTVNDLPPNEDVIVELRLRGYKVASKTVPWNGKRQLSITVPLEKAR